MSTHRLGDQRVQRRGRLAVARLLPELRHLACLELLDHLPRHRPRADPRCQRLNHLLSKADGFISILRRRSTIEVGSDPVGDFTGRAACSPPQRGRSCRRSPASAASTTVAPPARIAKARKPASDQPNSSRAAADSSAVTARSSHTRPADGDQRPRSTARRAASRNGSRTRNSEPTSPPARPAPTKPRTSQPTTLGHSREWSSDERDRARVPGCIHNRLHGHRRPSELRSRIRGRVASCLRKVLDPSP